MGCLFSKTSRREANNRSTTDLPPLINFINPIHSDIDGDLTSYEAACRLDPELQFFDSALQERTSRLINTLAVGVSVDRSISLAAFRDWTDYCLIEVNQKVVHFIVQCKDDIWRNPELSDLVDDYFKNCLLNLGFFNALDSRLKRARESLLIVKAAVQSFEKEEEEEETSQTEVYRKTLRKLGDFKASGDPFTEEFLSLFQSVLEQQQSMLYKLEKRKQKLDEELGSVRTWKNLSNVIFAATFASILICSVVVAAVAAPPVVAALVGAAASAPLGTMGSWINSFWKKYEEEVGRQGKMNDSMKQQISLTVGELETIQARVKRLKIKMEALLNNVDFAVAEDEGVIIAMAEIKKNINQFMQNVDELSERSHTVSQYIRKASVVILKKVIERPNTT
ncbi:UPF0496 protein 1-like [Diospyros lotus]|uniref:UPF0496 protein 1-like n=1 Tax=Diospyros lotus TaxID=55363 RepID=UPI002252CEF7|nr:UPF0496 protein 1-like [Diospyros lotus]